MPNHVKGAVYGLAAMTIWAGWSAATRLAVTTDLDALDIAALRYGIPGLLLLPMLIRDGLALDRLRWWGLALLIIGGGVPYALLAATGLRFAPAHDQAALNPGFMPLLVALFSAILLGETMNAARKVGLALILAGAIIIVGWHAPAMRSAMVGASDGWLESRSLGHVLFLSAALLWAMFTVVMRWAKLDPLHAVALVSVGSLIIYAPIYLVLNGFRLAETPLGDLAVQAIFQGVMVTIVSLVFYGRAVMHLGASGGSAFGALVPALSALFAIPLLGEWPSESDWVAITMVSLGVHLVSGGWLPSWARGTP